MSSARLRWRFPSRTAALPKCQPTRSEWAIEETLTAPDIAGINSGIYGPEVSVLGNRITGNDGIYNVGK